MEKCEVAMLSFQCRLGLKSLNWRGPLGLNGLEAKEIMKLLQKVHAQGWSPVHSCKNE